MKKLIYLFVVVASVSSFVSCSSDSDGGGNALEIDGQSVKIHNNNGALVYNTTSLDTRTSTSSRSFSMMVGDITPTTNSLDYIDVEVTYNNTVGINGTYTLSNGVDAGTATVDYYNDNNFFDENNGQGSLKVTDLGNNKFKLEFTSVSVTDSRDPATPVSAIVNGSVSTTFAVE